MTREGVWAYMNCFKRNYAYAVTSSVVGQICGWKAWDGLTRGQPITRLFIELHEKKVRALPATTAYVHERSHRNQSQYRNIRWLALVRTGSRRSWRQTRRKSFHIFQLTKKPPPPHHLHQLNEGAKRTELEGKLISAWNWELEKKKVVDRQTLSVRESWKQGNIACLQEQCEFH